MEERSEQELERELNEETSFVLFLYSPFCGTCHVTERMVTVLEKLYPAISFIKGNVNLLPEYVQTYQVTSIPGLHVFLEGNIVEKIYAFQSAPSLITRLDPLLQSYRQAKNGEG